ncbi:MAG: hypothetical protein GWN18_04280, partial [Thermoplasmata archaeon]|nr:hypothetical protein [Thermoplasmata archaeon]NIS19187.1 hypothetical protein [Thermoplasmata archaeon]NIU48321.1 hypothetical protein [Thermoplasmata archaeon]NIW81798.1 hypothetical protein [Thermoplasmata archaeon]
MVIVVVALLLLNLSIIVYFVHPAFNPDDDDGDVKEPEPEDDWLVPEEPEQLEQDVTWEGQDMFIERPLVLAPNIDLSIRDSDLRIHLEDLMFWLQPAIRVDNGASLDIRDSTIEVYQDPRLAASVVGGAYQRPDHHVPYIARVVNLDEAVDPVFHMDVQWLGNGTPVAVGVIPAGGTELVLLDTFTPDEGSSERWHHIQVELADYAGTRPWVVTWFYSYPDAPIFIGNLSVMEGGEWPPGDMFPTGHPMKDGWFASRFSDLPSLQRATFERGRWYGLERSWQPLIESEGDVMISGSSIIEPPGMGRKASGDIHKEDIDPETMMSIDQVGGHGGHIKMVGGSLRLTDSELVNVPVTGLNTSLYAEGSTFRGDHDLVSLHRPDGTFTECDFVTDPLSPDNPFNAYSYRYLWALGIEGGSDDGALEISDNLFSGSHIAIDLSHASVNIEGNTFSHIKGMSIWDHASEGLDWGWLSAHNTFEDHARNIYLKSTVTDVEFVHPDNETEEIQVYSSASIQTWLDLHSPFAGQLRSVYGNQIRYIVPRILIKASGEYQTSRVVHADVTWQHESEAFTFSPSDRQLTIDLSELFKEG